MEILDTSWAVPQADSKYDLHELGEPSLCLRAFSSETTEKKERSRKKPLTKLKGDSS